MNKIFGTDGVRGIVNKDITFELVYRIGQTVACLLMKERTDKCKILIGKDTRVSSDLLECAITAGICSVGCDVELLGVIPTPGVAILTNKYNADFGIMISASHNPIEFNGIKIFDKFGYKISEEFESEIETLVFNREYEFDLKVGTQVGSVAKNNQAVDDYVNYIFDKMPFDLSGVKVAVDCGNGSASFTAKKLFDKFGAQAVILNDKPDGTNINKDCGSTHLEYLIDYVKENNFDLGVAFDGDADRCLAVDDLGNPVDGDYLIALFCKYLKDQNLLKSDSVVVSIMANLGFFEFADKYNINVVKSKVGDKYVLDKMLAGGYNLGGEQSGHIIFLDYCPTGDGQISAVNLVNIYKNANKKLSEMMGVMKKYPQVIVNVNVENENKPKLDTDAEIAKKISEYEQKLSDKGRVIVRASGTEPLIRVMIEGVDFDEISNYALDISDCIKRRLS